VINNLCYSFHSLIIRAGNGKKNSKIKLQSFKNYG